MNANITLKQLEALYWIAQLGTFERAAARLYTTQSAISKRVHELERGSRIEVFDRSMRGAKLTARGEELFEVAKQILHLHDQITEIQQGVANRPRSLRIGVTELTTITWLPQLISAVKDQFSNVQISPKVDMSRALLSDLEQSQLDLIIIPEAFTLPEFSSVPIATVQNCWMAKKGLVNLAKPIRHRDLAEFPVLVQGHASGSGLYLNKWLKDRGVVFQETLVCDSMTALLGLTVAGLGVAYLPYQFCQRFEESGKLEIIETKVPLPPIPYVAMYRGDRPNAFIQEIAELAKSHCDFGSSYHN
ncbi:LysR family transcriptional regulator [Aliiroseovarius sp. S1339]|uniref:LysR family transcriptional regulator n=1 Tax=Aliiroseovarius sp. S1339 TaxID=2936990 RepID=UPI0020BFF940|nr:LysR family transcriptional regulator [Aliiroseovarius sp. S1339]MCK8463173.1 LysR family transcriptional regulator [Aliiroseovarius sp. S1339]